jgi:hypothetical protein
MIVVASTEAGMEFVRMDILLIRRGMKSRRQLAAHERCRL